MKKVLFLGLCFASTLLMSCSQDDAGSSSQTDELKGQAYLSLSLVTNRNNAPTRASGTSAGTAPESKVTTATAYLFDASQKLIKIVKYPTDANISAGSSPLTHVNNAVLVPAATHYAFIVTGPYQPAATVGVTTFATLNAALTPTIANVTTASDFTMTNEGYTLGAADEALANVSSNVLGTETLADASPAIINVNRVVAKVQVKQGGSFEVSPTGATATLKGWELDRTSKTFFPYAKKSSLTTSIYRQCPTYSTDITTTGANPNFGTYFNYSDKTYTHTDFTSDDAFEYCLENTMDAAKQMAPRTTAVLIQAYYKPAANVFYGGTDAEYTAENSYFVYGGQVYSLSQIKTLGASSDVYKELNKLAVAAGFTDVATSTEANWNGLDAETAKGYYDAAAASDPINITFYQKGLNYYRVLVRHDDTVTDLMALGRYGVVRNNWYTLNINSIKGTGSPWTPTPKDDEKDDTDLWLAVDIVVNPWTTWTQNVDL